MNVSTLVWPHLWSTDVLSLGNAHFCLKLWCQQIVFWISLFLAAYEPTKTGPFFATFPTTKIFQREERSWKWNWMRVDRKWLKMDENGWKGTKRDENGWKWMEGDEMGWQWVIVVENGLMLLKVDENYCWEPVQILLPSEYRLPSSCIRLTSDYNLFFN